MSKKPHQLDEQIWELPPPNGFDMWHRPEDDDPCVIEDGVCVRVAHLWPIAKGTKKPKAKA